MIHTLGSAAIVQQLGAPDCSPTCGHVRQLISGAPLLVGILISLPAVQSDTLEYEYKHAVATMKDELQNVNIGFSISHEYSDILHETSAAQAAEPLTPQHQKQITVTAAGVLVSYITSITISKQFYNTPLQLQISLRTESQPSRSLTQREQITVKEANVRALMDLNRYRPQAVVERTLSTPVQFVHPIAISFQVREIGPEQTILSVRVRNQLPVQAVSIHELKFHLDRLTTTAGAGSGSSAGSSSSGLQGQFQFAPIPCSSIGSDDGCTALPGPVILPQEEYTMLYAIRTSAESTACITSAAQYSAPCTVYWTTVGEDSPPAADQQDVLTNVSEHEAGENIGAFEAQYTEPREVCVEVLRLLATTAGQRGSGLYEFDCSVAWTLGSTFMQGQGHSAGRAMADGLKAVSDAAVVQVALQGPAVVRVNEAFVLRLSVTNVSALTLVSAVLHAPSSTESTHSGRGSVSYVVREAESTLGDVAPGSTAAAALTVTPLQPGRLLISEVFVTASDGSFSTRYRLRCPFQALVEEELAEVVF